VVQFSGKNVVVSYAGGEESKGQEKRENPTQNSSPSESRTLIALDPNAANKKLGMIFNDISPWSGSAEGETGRGLLYLEARKGSKRIPWSFRKEKKTTNFP